MIIDTNAYLGQWPFRRTPCDELNQLLEVYKRYGISEAWVGSLEGLFHRDMGGVNYRLYQTCQTVKEVRLVPFGSVNPRLPDWKEDLRRCAEEYKMPGIRLHPNYHRYQLDEPIFQELLELAAQYRLLLQLVVRMEDVRVQDARFTVPDVDLQPLPELLETRPEIKMMILNGFLHSTQPLLPRLLNTGRVWLEIATLEGLAGLEHILHRISANRIMFGSHVPLFSLESALLKLQEAELTTDIRETICWQNARHLLGRSQ
ncbi:MAG: amidohydrolase family protein [Thermoguttaceae bacterium]|nr:amidohydrolase family protein [Thermoguttaceae bacterium]MDW8038545.1 amidohydrolase family protein [Thermoguttaceae bacterium]